MKKISTVFIRDFTTRPYVITPEVTPGCEWVLDGEGVATRKWDGTCVLVRDGKLYARFDYKKGRTPPESFEPAQPEPDPETGHWPGWVLVEDQPQYKWHREPSCPSYDGTYELIGPKINGNPEDFDQHVFVVHGFLLAHVESRTLEEDEGGTDVRAYGGHRLPPSGWSDGEDQA